MPQLPVYTAPRQDLPMPGGRRAQSTDYYVPNDLAKTIGHVGESILTHVEEKEARTSLVSSSEIRAKYARELDAAAISGADVDKLKEQMQDEFSKVGENFQTRKGQQALQLYTSNTSLMFDEQANRITVQRAGAEAKLAGHSFLNSTAALLQNNPAYLATAETDATALVSTFSGVSPQARAELERSIHQELNMTAAISAARLDPLGTRKKLEAGEWNLTPEQRQTAVNKADTEHRAVRAEDEYLRAAAERDRRDRDNEARDKHFATIMDSGLPVKSIRRGIMDDADLRPETREHLITFMEHRAKELNTQEKKSDQAVMRDLWLRIHADDSDPRKIINGDAIFEAVKVGQINTTDANNLNTLVGGFKDENNKKIGTTLYGMSSAFQRSLEQDPRMAKQKFLGQIPAIVNEYTFMVQEQVAARRSENDVAGLRELFTPGTKGYVGSPEFMQQAVQRVESRQAEATRAKLPVAKTQAEYDALPVGPYIGPDGQPAIKAKIAAKGEDRAAWMQATGGALRPGETEAQAVARWKAGK